MNYQPEFIFRPISPRQERFVNEYMIDFNGGQAAVRAGYSEKHSGTAAKRLLASLNVQSAIQSRRGELIYKSKIDAERVLARYAEMAFGDIRDVVTWSAKGVSLTPTEKLSREQAGMVAEVSEGKEGLKVKLHSPLVALEGIRKMLGLDAPTRVAVEPPDPLAEGVRALKELFSLEEMIEYRDRRRAGAIEGAVVSEGDPEQK